MSSKDCDLITLNDNYVAEIDKKMTTTQKKITDSLSPTSVVSESIPSRMKSHRLHTESVTKIETGLEETFYDGDKVCSEIDENITQHVNYNALQDQKKPIVGSNMEKRDLEPTLKPLKSSKRFRTNFMLVKKSLVKSAPSASFSPSSFTLTTASETFSESESESENESDCVENVRDIQRPFQDKNINNICSIDFPRPLTHYNKYNSNKDMMWCYQVGPANRNYKSYNYDQYMVNPKIQNFWWKPEDFFVHQSILGSGKFGVVQRCVEKRSGISFAVKSLSKDVLFNNGNSLELLRREVEIQSRLDHAKIVKFHGYYHDSSTVYLVQELSTEGNLHQFQLYNGGSLPFHLASNYIDQVLRALSFMHANRVFHRDLKPENLLLFGPNQKLLKLCDFGWSIECRNSEYTRSTLCGTPEYVPIEMILNKSGQTTLYDVRYVDNWQCGILAYELVHNHTPFHTSRAKLNALQEEHGYDDQNDIIFDLIRKTTPVSHCDQHGKSEEVIFSDFIDSLTKKIPTQRLSVKEALHHKWIQSYEK